jgi:hypothetical protein
VRLWTAVLWLFGWLAVLVVDLGFVVALGVLACGFALGWAGQPLNICFVCPLLFAQGGGVECAFARWCSVSCCAWLIGWLACACC